MSLDAKNFDLDVFGFPNPKIEDFNTLGHGPRMFKAWNSRFLDPKTSNSELLTSWGHVPGC